MAEDKTFTQEKCIEFYYSANMRWPLADCVFDEGFSSKTKYSRHWEEVWMPDSHTAAVFLGEDLKSHIKFVNGEKNDIIMEEIALKYRNVVEHSKNFINPGFFVFKSSTQKSVDSAKPTPT